MTQFDFAIIGGGAAGMTAACHIWKRSPQSRILLIDRGDTLGGVLCQCIHHGFGLSYFGEDLTGTEYARRLEQQLKKTSVQILLCTEVLEVSPDKTITFSNTGGIRTCSFLHLILASGCTERALGSLGVSGTRPAGIFTAGEAQKLINIHHKDIGDKAVIIGSGDIGMILARRLSLCGKEVICMTEIADKSPALLRNRINCLEAFQIPLFLRTRLIEIHGYPHIEAVTLLDIPTNALRRVECSLLIIAAGLIPDRTLIQNFFPSLWETAPDLNALPEWLHLCGNCHHVHPIVDGVSFQAEKLADYILENI